MLRTTALSVILCLIISSPELFGADRETDEKTTETPVISDSIIIRANKADLAHSLEKEVGFTTVVDLDSMPATIRETSEVLEAVIGVNVSQYGGLGMFSLISIRGSESNQVALYFNGIPLNTASYGTSDLSFIPLEFLDHIEVYRGWVPSALGQPSMGGAINFVTDPQSEKKCGYFSLGYGSFNTFKTSFSLQSASEHHNFFVSGGFTQSEGNYPYRNDNGTPYDEDDDSTITRKNGDFSSQNALVSSQHELSDYFHLSLTTTYSNKAQGIPGTGTIQTSNSSLEAQASMVTLKANIFEIGHHSDELEVMLFFLYNRDLFDDSERELNVLSARSVSTTNRAGFESCYRYYLYHHHLLSFSVGTAWEENNTDSEVQGVFTSGEISKERWLGYGSIDTELNYFNGQFTMRPSLRYDLLSNTDSREGQDDYFHTAERPPKTWSFWSPQLAAKWQITDGFTLKTSAGFYSRYPTLYELYGDRGATVGNPELDPETGINRDLGFLWTDRFRGLFLFLFEYAFFVKESEDLLVLVQNSQYTFRPENIGKARIHGHEFHCALSTAQLVEWSLNYTYQDARDRSEIPYYRDNHLPHRPVHELSTELTLLIEPTSLSYQVTYQSGNYHDRANKKEVPDRLIHNLSFNWDEILEGVRLSLEVKNLSDNQIADVAGYPLPGRSFYANLSYHF